MKKIIFTFFIFNFLVCDFEEFIFENSSLDESFLKNDIDEIKKDTFKKAINFLEFIELKAEKYKLLLSDGSLENKKIYIENKENFNNIEKTFFYEKKISDDEINKIKNLLKEKKAEECNLRREERLLIEIYKRLALRKEISDICEKEKGFSCDDLDLLICYEELLIRKVNIDKILDEEKLLSFTDEEYITGYEIDEIKKLLERSNFSLKKWIQKKLF